MSQALKQQKVLLDKERAVQQEKLNKLHQDTEELQRNIDEHAKKEATRVQEQYQLFQKFLKDKAIHRKKRRMLLAKKNNKDVSLAMPVSVSSQGPVMNTAGFPWAANLQQQPIPNLQWYQQMQFQQLQLQQLQQLQLQQPFPTQAMLPFPLISAMPPQQLSSSLFEGKQLMEKHAQNPIVEILSYRRKHGDNPNRCNVRFSNEDTATIPKELLDKRDDFKTLWKVFAKDVLPTQREESRKDKNYYRRQIPRKP
jgi:hypothetical protein